MEDNFKTTTNHTVIQSWIGTHSGKPALITDPNRLNQAVGLRVDFPGHQDEALLSHAHHNSDVSWEKFFQVFEDQALAFEYSDDSDLDLMDSYRFVKREALKDEAPDSRFNPTDFAQVSHPISNSEVTRDVSEDEHGDQELGGSNVDLEADDDTTKGVADLGIVAPDDIQAKHDRE